MKKDLEKKLTSKKPAFSILRVDMLCLPKYEEIRPYARENYT